MHLMHPLLTELAIKQMREEHANAACWQASMMAMRQARPERVQSRSRFQSVLTFLLTF